MGSVLLSGTPGLREQLHRRLFLTRSAGAVLAAASGGGMALGGLARAEGPDGRGLIVRNRRPLDLETPVPDLDQWLTPIDRFFVRSHFGAPAIGTEPWGVLIGGLVHRPLNLSPAGLGGFALVTVAAVLQCSGNGRVNFRPGIPGVGWDRGAVGHAEWTGVRLAEILERAGIRDGAGHVHFLGGDGPPSPKTPSFFRSLPLEKSLHPDTLLATGMNGQPLPILHGGPVRLVVPGWAGNHWMKWLRTVTVSEAEAPGFYMQAGYRMPRSPAPPDAVLKPADLVPVTALNVKSLITSPAEGSILQDRRVEVHGVAWTGEGHVTRVEVALGQGRDAQWRPATLLGQSKLWSWRQWTFAFDATSPGPMHLRARATDSRGEIQPEATPWNRSGYLWNGIDHVTCEVR